MINMIIIIEKKKDGEKKMRNMKDKDRKMKKDGKEKMRNMKDKDKKMKSVIRKNKKSKQKSMKNGKKNLTIKMNQISMIIILNVIAFTIII